MNLIKRTAALLICIVLTLGCLASCVNKGGGGTGEEIRLDKYAARISIKYATNDNKMKEAVDNFATPDAFLRVDGDNLVISTSAKVDGISVSNEYTYFEEILYLEQSVTVGDKSVSSYEKSAMSGEDKDKLISKAGVGADIGIGDFVDCEITNSGSAVVYSCANMNAESKESLCKIISAGFASMNATVNIDSATYYLEAEGERNLKSILSCNFIITLEGVDYELTMHLYYDYDYQADFDISAPDNNHVYEDVSVEDIIG